MLELLGHPSLLVASFAVSFFAEFASQWALVNYGLPACLYLPVCLTLYHVDGMHACTHAHAVNCIQTGPELLRTLSYPNLSQVGFYVWHE